ncbi:hypothetical protein FKW77_008084 [Venturia effusa]|uniref:Amino-acid transporter arg-13 n=1 Tax=Venturia effusa TaxID=50376 RepID=A0A517LBC6_9PEZI|nr:hypothetical protein FKW77_008084 [Venturia effusa]
MDASHTAVSIEQGSRIILAQDNAPATEKLAQQGLEAVKDVAFGSTAGIVGKFIEYPFDTVKVRLQSSSQYSGPVDCFRQGWRQDGFSGLYRGISAPLVGAAVETSSLFFSYRLAQEAFQSAFLPMNEPLSMSALLLCGSISGAFTSLLLTPIELVKCKLQVPLVSSAVKAGPLSVISSIYRHQGLKGFWHGQMGTLIRETGGSAAWFGSYEGMSILFRKLDKMAPKEALPMYQQMVAGAVAGMSYNFIFFPADTIKSRMQTEDVREIAGGGRTFMAVGNTVWQQQGLKGLYRGCGITVARSAPSSAFIFTVYEALRRTFV